MEYYEIALEQTYFGQQVINRWNYTADTIPSGQLGALLALVGMGFMPFTDIEAFGSTTVAGILQTLQSSEAIFVQAICKNIFNPLDYYAYAFPPDTHGISGGGDGMSPTAAFAYTTDRTRSDMRRGQKRFVGIEEGNVAAGGVLINASAFQTLGDAMADINLVPVGGSGVTFTPYVFGRVEYTTPSGKKGYKYYASPTLQADHIMRINQWVLKPQIRTQASRQYGRGA